MTTADGVHPSGLPDMSAAGDESPTRPLRVIALVKQVPALEAMEFGDDGRLRRDGLPVEMNPYCRRAVAKAVGLARATGGTCTAVTLGPRSAEDVLREAIACGANSGVLITDPAFAGSDTYATAQAIYHTLRLLGQFDLVLVGRNSVDADTGQTGPQLAELLDLPFAASVRELEVAPTGGFAHIRCEDDDGSLTGQIELPAVVSVAERLCAPAKADPVARAAVEPHLIRIMSASELGPGPWGSAGSLTRVGAVRRYEATRERRLLRGRPESQVERLLAELDERGALDAKPAAVGGNVPTTDPTSTRVIGAIGDPQRARALRELLGKCAQLAAATGARTVAVTVAAANSPSPHELASWGADEIVEITGTNLAAEDVAAGVIEWCHRQHPEVVLCSGTLWGREVASRVGVAVRGGLTGDAVDVVFDPAETTDGFQFWKPALAGQLLACITAVTPTRLVTVRPGMLPALAPRKVVVPPTIQPLVRPTRARVHIYDRTRDDEINALIAARNVVGVGTGVAPNEYPELAELLGQLDAVLGCTRKVTDQAWLPRSRQIGITGRCIAPNLYLALGVSGKFNHMVGVRGAGTVVAVNTDESAPVFDAADVGLVADWHAIVPPLASALALRRAASRRRSRIRVPTT